MQTQGGVSRYWYELMKNLSELGVETVRPDSLNRNVYMKLLGSRLYFRKYPPKTTRIINRISTKISDNYLRKQRFDVYHQTYFDKNFNRINAPKIITVFDMIHEKFPESIPPWDPAVLYKKTNCEAADKIIAISNSTKKDLIDLFDIKPNKIEVVYFGNSFKNNGKIHLEKEKYFLFVGKRSSYKNFENTLYAFHNFSKSEQNYKLVCAGGEPVSAREKLLLSSLGLDNQVNFLSEVSDEDINDLYQNAAALIYPSKYEGFGLPITEAQSLGCPVITSDVSSMPEVAGTGAVLVDPYSIPCITAAMHKAIIDKDTLIEAGLENVKRFCWRNCALETIEAYERLT